MGLSLDFQAFFEGETVGDPFTPRHAELVCPGAVAAMKSGVMESSRIDWDQFDGILGEPEPETLEILAEFQTDCRGLIEKVAAQDEPAAGARVLHQLKGVSLNLGFQSLATLASEHDQRAREGIRPDWPALAERLRGELELSLAELQRERPGFFAEP